MASGRSADSGGKVVQETRRWDEARAKRKRCAARKRLMIIATSRIRILVSMHIDDEWKDAGQNQRFLSFRMRGRRDISPNTVCLSYDAEVITSSKKLADFFEESLNYTKDAKAVSNWIMGDLLGYLNANSLELDRCEDYRQRAWRNDRLDRKRND